MNELTAFATNRLYFALPHIGIVATRLDEAASTFNDTSEDPSDREAALAKCLKDMRALTPEALHAALGLATYGVSPRRRGTPQMIQRYFGASSQYMVTINEYRKGNQVLDAALALTTAYSYLLCRFAWPDELTQDMQRALQASSGKPWREAANGLYEHARAVGEKYGKDEEDEGEEADEAASTEVAQ